MLEPINLRSYQTAPFELDFDTVVCEARTTVFWFPSEVLVGRYETLVSPEVDPNRFKEVEYMRARMSEISEPVERETCLIAPNAGPYSLQGHLLVFYSGERSPCEAFLDLSEEERLELVRAGVDSSKALFQAQSMKRDGKQIADEVIWLINRGDVGDPQIKNQSIPRVHIHVLLRDSANWSIVNFESLKSNEHFERILDAVGISELTLVLNEQLSRRLRESQITRGVVIDRSRYLEIDLGRVETNMLTPILAQTIEAVCTVCEDLMRRLKSHQISYGYSIAVLLNSSIDLRLRVGLYKDYAETLFGPVIFRTPASLERRVQLEHRIKYTFEQFKEALLANCDN